MSDFIFTISEIARLANITTKTIRHYHAIGLLAEPKRDTNNYRMYSVAHLERLQQIQRLKTFGLSLQQVKLIFASYSPDELLRVVLQKHQQSIQDEIVRLQHQLHNIEAYLVSDTTIQMPSILESAPQTSSINALSSALKVKSNSLSDVLVAVESVALAQVDRYEWTEGYEAFWHQVGHHIGTNLIAYESLFIFWMERYLALGDMEADDLQGMAWLKEIEQSQSHLLLAQLFQAPQTTLLEQKEQEKMHKLVSAFLYQGASPLQKKLLKALTKR